jgi:hypothetical protein
MAFAVDFCGITNKFAIILTLTLSLHDPSSGYCSSPKYNIIRISDLSCEFYEISTMFINGLPFCLQQITVSSGSVVTR